MRRDLPLHPRKNKELDFFTTCVRPTEMIRAFAERNYQICVLVTGQVRAQADTWKKEEKKEAACYIAVWLCGNCVEYCM